MLSMKIETLIKSRVSPLWVITREGSGRVSLFRRASQVWYDVIRLLSRETMTTNERINHAEKKALDI